MLAVVMGTVRPESGGWFFDETFRIPIHGDKWMIVFRDSQFHAFIDGEEPDDLPTFMNEVGSIVQGCLDSLGFHLATPLRAEIRSMVADGNKLVHRRASWPELLPEPLTEPSAPYVAADKLQPFITATIEEPLARLALADLRSAIDSPDDTVYLAYRATESVRQWFQVGEADNRAAQILAWEDMRAALDLDKSCLTELGKRARSRRHGGLAPPTENQWKEVLLLARDVVARFIAHVNKRGTSPSEADSREVLAAEERKHHA